MEPESCRKNIGGSSPGHTEPCRNVHTATGSDLYTSVSSSGVQDKQIIHGINSFHIAYKVYMLAFNMM